jgi:formate-dependent nitrite reductase cytochrome c552 subunit
MIRPNAHLPGVIHGDLRKANAPKLPPTNDPTNDVHWVMGGWYKEESYIRTNRPGDPYAYTVTQFQWDPIKATYVSNQSLRDWTVKCAGCHTTGYNPATRTWNELNIGCEACHGPGSDHVDSEGDRNLITIDTSTEGCGYCHIRAENVAMGGFTNKQFNFPIGYVLGQPSTLQFIPEPLSAAASFYPDGTANRHRQQYLEMNHPARAPSAHYVQGVSCTSCHDPHTAGMLNTYANGLPAGKYGIKIYDNVHNATNYVAWEGGDNLWHPATHASITKQALCKACHTGMSDHHVHQFNAAAAAANVSCVDCHMPDVINIDPVTLRQPWPRTRLTPSCRRPR